MKLWIVKHEELHRCGCHWQTYVVAAKNQKQIEKMFPQKYSAEKPLDIQVFELPNLKRIKKAMVIV